MGSAAFSQVSACHCSHVRMGEEMDSCMCTENQNNSSVFSFCLPAAHLSPDELMEGTWAPAERQQSKNLSAQLLSNVNS